MTSRAERIARAVSSFWATREAQAAKPFETRSGDTGRQAAAGGKHLDQVAELIRSELIAAGLPPGIIHKARPALPGYFRPTKRWDLIIVYDGVLIAAIELKSIVGSFGNNLNNRIEESVGSAHDLWTAVDEQTYGTTVRPWLGYVFLMEVRDGPGGSTHPVRIDSPHVAPAVDFAGTSYVQRAEIAGRRLVMRRLYDAVWLILSKPDGSAVEPDPGMGGEAFFTELLAYATSKYEVLRGEY